MCGKDRGAQPIFHRQMTLGVGRQAGWDNDDRTFSACAMAPTWRATAEASDRRTVRSRRAPCSRPSVVRRGRGECHPFAPDIQPVAFLGEAVAEIEAVDLQPTPLPNQQCLRARLTIGVGLINFFHHQHFSRILLSKQYRGTRAKASTTTATASAHAPSHNPPRRTLRYTSTLWRISIPSPVSKPCRRCSQEVR